MFTKQALSFVVNHVVLPPKLPQTANEPGASGNEGTEALLKLANDCAEEFGTVLSKQLQGWSTVTSMLRNLETAYLANNSQDVLKQTLKGMTVNGKKPYRKIRTFALEEQNAALFIRRTEDDFTFSCFEISALAEQVMDANGALVWTFPGRSVAVHAETVLQECFMDQLTLMLQQLAQEPVESMAAVTKKAGSKVRESRDTVNPAMVSDLVMALLAGYGGVVPTSGITKRIRDERLHLDARQNWSRSPVWTIIKVSTQLACMHQFPEAHHIPYKNFMCLLIAKIVKLSLNEAVLPHEVYAASAKLAKRTLKLDKSLYPLIHVKVQKTMCLSQAYLDNSWNTSQQQNRRTLPLYNWVLREGMTDLELKNCKEAIDKILQRDLATSPREKFRPRCDQRMQRHQSIPVVGFSSSSCELDLFDVERWAAEILPAQEFGKSEACLTGLHHLLQSYIKAAVTHYKGQPEQLSVMILTAVEIWIAVDKIALERWPILGEYEPEIPISFLESCLLPERSQMRRLQAVEAYLSNRWKRSKGHGIFEGTSSECLAVKFFDQSPCHQELCAKIEADANRLWSQKRAEWSQATARYEELIRDSVALECDYGVSWNGFRFHRNGCEKCKLYKQAKKMTINVYEWPLPRHEDNLKAAVFEMNVPVGLGDWRDACWTLAQDLGRKGAVGSSKQEGTLHGFPGLHGFSVNRGERLRFASSTKPFHRAHYNGEKFPVKEASLRVNHGQNYALYDFEKSRWAHHQTETPDTSRLCRSLLPKGPYSYLQYAVDGTSHLPNAAIAIQNDAGQIDPHEHYAFASLRAGQNLQWLHISQALTTPELSLDRGEAAILIYQAALQAGKDCSASSVLRQAHRIFEDRNFVNELLDNINYRFESIRGNWKEGNALLILVSLTLRARSLAPTTQLVDKTTRLLQSVRHVALIWARELNGLRPSDNSGPDIALRDHLLRAAFAAKATFDGEGLLAAANQNDVALFIEASIHIHDNSPTKYPGILDRLACRDRRLSHHLEPILKRAAMKHSAGIDRGVKAYWDRFVLSQQWSTLSEPNQRWIKTSIAADQGSSTTDVHLNLLSGELLVNGSPLGRLPQAIKLHPLYRRVFDQVMVSEVPGLDYVTVAPQHQQYLYFSLRGDELIVQTRSGNRILELVPHTLFTLDLPACLVDGSTHWIDARQRSIEIRPLDNIWTASEDNWKLVAVDTKWQAIRHHERLVDCSRFFYKDVVQIMSPIEEAKHVVVTACDDGSLQASLPRYNLRFFVNDMQELECRERRAVVDANQEVGSFVGLQNYLVLCNAGSASRQFKRQLVVPRGAVTLKSVDDHIQVFIDKGFKSTVRYSIFTIDTILRRIQTDGTVDGLFKAYLHAVTASILSDPLTGRTGTEESLACLRKVHLLEPPNEEAVDLLDKIQELSPQRSFYPEHLRRMQRIIWHPQLSPHTQHEEFEVLAKQIFDNAARLTVFYDAAGPEKSMQKRSESALINRAAIRNAMFRTQGYGGERSARAFDAIYPSRDHKEWDQNSTNAFDMSSLLHSWKPNTAIIHDLSAEIQKFGTVTGFGADFGITPILLSNVLQLGLAQNWGTLFNTCRRAERCESPRIAFLLGTLAFAGIDMYHLRTLAAIAISGAFGADEDRAETVFDLTQGTKPTHDLLEYINEFVTVQPLSEYASTDPELSAEWKKLCASAKGHCDAVHRHLLSQWPASSPELPPIDLSCLDTGSLLQGCRAKFSIWYANKMLIEYLDKIQRELKRIIRPPGPSRGLDFFRSRPSMPLRTWSQPFQTFRPRECKQGSLQAPRSLTFESEYHSIRETTETAELETILSSVHKADQEYIEDLSGSLRRYMVSKVAVMPAHIPIEPKELRENYELWSELIQRRLAEFTSAYRSNMKPELLTDAWRFGARITIDEILKSMRLSTSDEDSACPVLGFAHEIACMQRAQRMIMLAEKADVSNFVKEAEHGDQRAWGIHRFPEWLALELENDMAIRPLQARVAQEMITPTSGKNSTLQLNMGEGKSAVIVHMVAATLANKKQICRLLILKPLMRQMMNLLVKRHQGIASRPLYHIPFSRGTPMSHAVLDQMMMLWTECRDSGGILLVQPGHTLSFMLMGIERIGVNPNLGRQLIRAYKDHRKMSRDVLDESDEILNTTFQLVYAMGAQQHLEGHPDRWTCQASILDRVEDVLKSDHVDGLTANSIHDGSFPRMSFTRTSGNETLMRNIVSHVMTSGAPRLTLDTFASHVRTTIARFLTEIEISDHDWKVVENSFSGPALRNILLLRGLLARGVLRHGLQAKRWLVNYGLDLSRSMLAVPYNAKGVPSPRSEFGHPDVAVLFTYLSYYNEGLDEDQLRRAFAMLYRCPDPSQEYLAWVGRSSTLPAELRDLRSVNLEDPSQLKLQLMPGLKYNKKTIDFYLSQVVFPAEAKEFPQKLSTSAWDLPAEPGAPVTTGFSGTNDNKSLLPRSIRQEDLPELRGTNAMVMSYLLLPDNRACLQLNRSKGQSELMDLLGLLNQQTQRVQVLIDVGALIIEAGNEEVASSWLEWQPDMEAALYFDASHEMIVIDRVGRKEPFQSSPYKDCLDKCLVYLDEYHTRGTDLKLPATARAAVTISSWLTKDRLVQACMRMRGLGKGQSLMFVINEEVATSISDNSPATDTRKLDSSDILQFCLSRTCADNEHLRPLWAVYGIGHRLRQLATNAYYSSDKDELDDKKFLENTLEADARSLARLYAPSVAQEKRPCHPLLNAENEKDHLVNDLRRFINQLPQGVVEKSSFNEEQEREVDQEVQRMEEKQRPPNMDPHQHAISPGLEDFIRTGDNLTNGLLPATAALGKATFMDTLPSELFSHIRVTKDFVSTVKLTSDDASDLYLRPPTYVLTGILCNTLVLISPYEANELFWTVNVSTHTSLRMYAPRSMKSMRALDTVGLHTFSGDTRLASQPWTAEQRRALNLFAGQLYCESLEEYNDLRRYFAKLSIGDAAPQTFLSNLTAVRRKGKEYASTHLDKLINGRTLTKDEV